MPLFKEVSNMILICGVDHCLSLLLVSTDTFVRNLLVSEQARHIFFNTKATGNEVYFVSSSVRMNAAQMSTYVGAET